MDPVLKYQLTFYAGLLLLIIPVLIWGRRSRRWKRNKPSALFRQRDEDVVQLHLSYLLQLGLLRFVQFRLALARIIDHKIRWLEDRSFGPEAREIRHGCCDHSCMRRATLIAIGLGLAQAAQL